MDAKSDREKIIEKTINRLSSLPDSKLLEVADFTEFLAAQVEASTITQGILKLADQSGSFEFLKEEEEIYSVKDLKEKY